MVDDKAERYTEYSTPLVASPRRLLSKAVLSLEQTHLQLENVHWRRLFAVLTHWLVSFSSGCANAEISAEGNKQKGMLCVEDESFVLFILPIVCLSIVMVGWVAVGD